MSEERQSVNMDEFAEKFANVYFIKLLFKEDIKIPHETLYTKLDYHLMHYASMLSLIKVERFHLK